MSGSLATPERTAPTSPRELLTELGDLKRTRSAGRTGSLAERAFARAWAALCAGDDAQRVMLASVAHALAAARLGDLDRAKLEELGLDEDQTLVVLRRSFDAVTTGLDPALVASLRQALGTRLPGGPAPRFVAALAAQPRAGATCPGKPRILFEPPENHAEHCWAVAIYGVVLAPRYRADPRKVFLAGLAHHLHNATIPDSGFTGEMLLGGHLDNLCAVAGESALSELPEPLRAEIVGARAILPDAATPEGRAFHAADVIDRVAQMSQHLRVATVSLPMLFEEWALVHDGPVKAFHDAVLVDIGLL